MSTTGALQTTVRMSANYVPSNLPVEPWREPTSVSTPPGWPVMAGTGAEEERGIPWSRYLSALRRYKWMILLIVAAGTAAGIGATRFMAPEYQVQGTVWISDDNDTRGTGPVRGSELLNSNAWADLLRSSAIMDRVVQRLALYRWPAEMRDSTLLDGFTPGSGFRPGTYQLTVDPSGTHYTLALKDGPVLERGAVGDSIGRRLGFLWQPPASALPAGRVIGFTVVNPRAIANGIATGLDVTLPDRSNFMRVTLTGRNPRRTARILNAVMDEFVSTAGDLKRRNLIEMANTLETQLDTAQRALNDAESGLQSFRTSTITLPSEAITSSPDGGAAALTNPVFSSYFAQKMEADNLQYDRERLQAILANPSAITPDAFVGIQSAQQSPDLQAALQELTKRQAALRNAREIYTDEHPTVKNLAASVAALKSQTIAQILRGLVAQLGKRENDLNSRMSTASAQLKGIPARTIELLRHQRDVQTKSQLYTMLQQRLEESRLAAASATPDVSVLDTAVAPLMPTKNTAPSIVLLALVASLGGAVGLALLLDHTDPRFRYPEQVTDELGLPIFGAVPTIRRARAGESDPEEAAQVIEAFRSIRMAITNAFDPQGPIAFTISSPGAGDGKSLVASNLALSFAEAGYRTVLVDGDTRRGQLHAMFGATRRPGLLDYLGGDAPLETILRASTHERLALIPCGTRRHRGPELLHSQAMSQLQRELRARFDVIVTDSPPLGAGVDPFVLGTATGNMLLVLRTGATDRKMAESKIKLFERLPVRVLGAVLNDIPAQGVYRYYSYLYGYTTSEDDELPKLAPQVG